MRRRALLATIGLAGSNPVAGCLESGSLSFGDETHDGKSPADGATNARPPEVPTDCPQGQASRVHCFPAPPDLDITLTRSDPTVSPGETIAFELENGSDEEVVRGRGSWWIWKHIDGDWFRISRRLAVPSIHRNLDPDETFIWEFTIDNAGIEAGAPVEYITDQFGELTYRGLGGGDYVFGVYGGLDGELERERLWAIPFAVDADPLALTPTNAIETTAWEDETLVAESTRVDPNENHDGLGAYELTRVENPAEEPVPRITEQVLVNGQLRDTLALAREYDAEQVRLEEYSKSIPMFRIRSNRIYSFDGDYYTVRTWELKE